MYTVIQITKLTPAHISVLLSDDVAYDVDRGSFETYIAPTGEYEYNQVVETGPHEYDTISGMLSLSDYWDEFTSNDIPVIADLNDFISHSKSTQLDIDVVRAWSDCHQFIDDNMNLIDGLVMKTFVKSYGTAQFNLVQYKNQ